MIRGQHAGRGDCTVKAVFTIFRNQIILQGLGVNESLYPASFFIISDGATRRKRERKQKNEEKKEPAEPDACHETRKRGIETAERPAK